jgi:dehydrogenase/reductase SDR family protein 12
MIDSILDKTIFFSFDRSGFQRHQKRFTEDLKTKNLKGQTFLVTGGTGGIGEETSRFLSQAGGTVFFTGRNLSKGSALEKENTRSTFISLDIADWKKVYEFARTCESFDHLVFNAGGMPETYTENASGVEFQCASQLLGHFYLLTWLKEFNKIKAGARIIWVSSGGMYLKKLDLNSLFQNPKYEKVGAYANVKRAQVTLVEELAHRKDWSDFYHYSMHPGWVKTEGVKEALPTFYSLMEKRLRTPLEGADTILWLLMTETPPKSGYLYFDRKKVSAYLSESYRPTAEVRARLIERIEHYKNIIK